MPAFLTRSAIRRRLIWLLTLGFALVIALLISNGEGYISPAASQAVLQDYRKQAKAPIDLLTARESDVLQLVAEGFTNKQIAKKLNLSIYTAEGYRRRIMEKLNLHSTGELVRFAMRAGLID